MLAIPLYDDNPTRRVPIVTYGVIAACVVVFLWQSSLGPRSGQEAAFAFGMVPAVLFGYAELPTRLEIIPAWATLFTSMFMHGGWLHLIGNMLYLWIFGKGVEAALGSLRFLPFYLICGVAAALTQAFINPETEVPMIGASGAIAGILGAYIVLYPKGNVAVFIWIFIFIRLVAVPAVILLGLWFLAQLMSALSAAPSEPGVAFWAHVGGFLTGMILVMFFRRPGVGLLQPARSSPFVVTHRPSRSARGPWG